MAANESLGSQWHPHVEERISGGIGHVEGSGSRSVVGFVPPSTLIPYREHSGIQNPNVPGHDRKIIDGIRADIRSGVGIKTPLMLEYDHTHKLGSLGEGNHRLQAAIEEKVPVVPVRVYGRSHLAHRKEKGLTAPLEMKTQFNGGTYVPPEIHPAHFFDDRRS